MRNLLAVLVGLAVLVACDPTKKEDMSCTAQFDGVTEAKACSELHITSAEGIVAEQQCKDKLAGSWSSSACPAENRVAGGYCKIDASDYTLSGSDVKVFFYSPVTLLAAQEACSASGGTWVNG
jgi:hypothetical protein